MVSVYLLNNFRIPEGLGELKLLLENHINNQGLAAIEKLGDEALNVRFKKKVFDDHQKVNFQLTLSWVYFLASTLTIRIMGQFEW